MNQLDVGIGEYEVTIATLGIRLANKAIESQAQKERNAVLQKEIESLKNQFEEMKKQVELLTTPKA